MPKEEDIKAEARSPRSTTTNSTYPLPAPEAQARRTHRTPTLPKIHSTDQSSTHAQKLYRNSQIKKEIMPPPLLARIPDLGKMFSHRKYLFA